MITQSRISNVSQLLTDEQKSQIHSCLRSSRYFQHVSDEILEKIILMTNLKTLEEGELILEQGKPNQEIYIISNGTASVYVDEQFIYDLYRRGDLFGEMSVITQKPSSATIIAKTRMEMVTLSVHDVNSFHREMSDNLSAVFYEWFSKILSDKLYLTSQKAKLYEDMNHRFEHDLQVARQLQQKTLESSRTPIPGFDCFLKSEFADSLGGDVYAVFKVDEDHYGILLGDVSGHGTAASLLSMTILNLFSNFSRGRTSSQETVSFINDLCEHTMLDDRFVTIFYAIYNKNTHKLTYTNGGHHAALLIRGKNVLSLPQTAGIPIGLFSTDMCVFSESTFQLKPGDRLLIFTDALVENGSIEGEEMETEGLIRCLKKHSKASSEDLLEILYEAGKGPENIDYSDDFTLLVFELENPS